MPSRAPAVLFHADPRHRVTVRGCERQLERQRWGRQIKVQNVTTPPRGMRKRKRRQSEREKGQLESQKERVLDV